MNMKDLKDFIASRRSIRKWKPDSVPEEMALKAIELATWAPSGGNFQNWKYLLISNRDLIRAMADTVQTKVDTLASWPEASAYGEDVHRWQKNAHFSAMHPTASPCSWQGMTVLPTKYSTTEPGRTRPQSP
jgi:Nitroreductase